MPGEFGSSICLVLSKATCKLSSSLAPREPQVVSEIEFHHIICFYKICMDGDCIINTHQHKAIQTKYVKVNVQYVRQGPFTIFHQLWVWVEVRTK